MVFRVLSLGLLFVLISSNGWAWGKRGHEIAASLAAEMASSKPQLHFLKNHAFDLGYYTNVPDIIWRNRGEKISKTEGPLHYLDWTPKMKEIFGSPANIPLEYKEFKKKMGKAFKRRDGLVLWRISDLAERCEGLAKKEMNEKTQGQLLVCLGILSHYVGDLSMPLHVAENHDGEMTGQKGIHSYFEAVMVDALDPDLKPEVLKAARDVYAQYLKNPKPLAVRVRELMAESLSHSEELLALDKKIERKNIAASARVFEPMIKSQLARGAAAIAVVWEEVLKNVSEFNDKKFYFFDGEPEYIYPSFEGPGFKGSEKGARAKGVDNEG